MNVFFSLMNESDSVSGAVIEAVAEAKGVDPMALDTPLYDAVDLDALGRLFRDGSGEVTFEYTDFRVTVDSESHVTLVPLLEE